MATVEHYYFGQGKCWSRRLNVANGKWRWWGDVSALTMALELEEVTHKESYSGNKGNVRKISTSRAINLNATMHQLDTDSLAELLYGQASTIAAGAVVGEVLPTVVAGDIVKLDFGGVSALVLTDSATPTPATITSGNYDLDPRYGSLEIKTLPSAPAPTQPLKAAYSHSGGKQVNFLTQAQPEVEFRFEGINLAEGNEPVILELYKMSTGPLQELALINNDQALAGVPVTLASLIDSSKPAAGQLGQFGRFIQITA